MPYKATPALQQYAPLLRRLLRLTEDTAKSLRELRKPLVPDRILLALLGKAADTLRGVLVLQKHGLCHEAQSLARTLFELRLSFDAFAEMLHVDARSACIRVMDTVMLEKVKQARASQFKGLDLIPNAPTPEELEDTEKEIASRYSAGELKRFRQHGFSGVNVEQRAKRSGLSDEYNIAYRNFSRNVHSTDFTELFLQEDPELIASDVDSYLDSRDAVCCEVAFISVAGIAIAVNDLVGLGLDRRIRTLMRAREELQRARRIGEA
jgi:hypothetical protein